jgi:hypothetical protein
VSCSRNYWFGTESYKQGELHAKQVQAMLQAIWYPLVYYALTLGANHRSVRLMCQHCNMTGIYCNSQLCLATVLQIFSLHCPSTYDAISWGAKKRKLLNLKGNTLGQIGHF